jgi:hypothetical protein
MTHVLLHGGWWGAFCRCSFHFDQHQPIGSSIVFPVRTIHQLERIVVTGKEASNVSKTLLLVLEQIFVSKMKYI